MDKDLNNYLKRFQPIDRLPRDVLLKEMDRAWDEFSLDNRRPLRDQAQAVAKFYSHPVWVLNGVFSGVDQISATHRVAIANYVKELGAKRVADYGGGGGALAKQIVALTDICSVDIIEPFPSSYFLGALEGIPRLRFTNDFESEYDVVVAQDVLEHVDDPIKTVEEMISATKLHGQLIFANSFWPEIKCHLPATFYLRYQFASVLKAAGLRQIGRVSDVNHSQVFVKEQPLNAQRLRQAAERAKRWGSVVNAGRSALSSLRRRFFPFA